MNNGYSGPDEPTIAQERLMPPTSMQREGWPPISATLPAASPFGTRKTVNPEQLIRRSTASLPRNPVQRIVYLWHSDPAHKVFLVAIATGIVSALVAVILITGFISNIFASPATVSQSYTPTAAATLVPTPVGNTQNSLPPPSTTPIVIPTTIPTPTPVMNAPLTLQIINAPATAKNGSSFPVSIATNQPGISVRLSVAYTISPNNSSSGSHMTDGNGNVTINWHVVVVAFNPKHSAIIAHITAVARDQNGQTVSSQTISVQITNRG